MSADGNPYSDAYHGATHAEPALSPSNKFERVQTDLVEQSDNPVGELCHADLVRETIERNLPSGPRPLFDPSKAAVLRYLEPTNYMDFLPVQREILARIPPAGLAESIPDEIWRNIIVHCDDNKGLASMRRVSKRFRRIVTDNICVWAGWKYTKRKLYAHFRDDERGFSAHDYFEHICRDIELLRTPIIMGERDNLVYLISQYGGVGSMLVLAEHCPEVLYQYIAGQESAIFFAIGYAVEHSRPVALEHLIDSYGKREFERITHSVLNYPLQLHPMTYLETIAHKIAYGVYLPAAHLFSYEGQFNYRDGPAPTADMRIQMLTVLHRLFPNFRLTLPDNERRAMLPTVRDYFDRVFSDRHDEIFAPWLEEELPDDSDEMDLVNG